MGALDIQVVIDCTDPRRLAEFWAATLGYVMQPPPPGFDSWEQFADQIGVPPDLLAAVVDPERVKPRILFQKGCLKPRQ
jgi:glyoxalase superfamily protein